MLRIARAAMFAVLPAELLLVVLLVAGVSLPVPLLVGAEVAVAAVLVLEATVAYRLFRAGRRAGADRRKALRATVEGLVPSPVRRIVGFELKGAVSLVLWAARRRDGVPPGAVAVPYSGGQSWTLLLLVFAMAVETAVVDLVLLSTGVPTAPRLAVLVIDLSGIVYALAFAAACVTRPHVVTPAELRLRYGAYLDLRVPRVLISSVRVSPCYNESGMVTVQDGRLGLAVGSQTNVVVELSEPVTVVRPLGGLAEATVIRLFTDTPGVLVSALRSGEHAAAPATPTTPTTPGIDGSGGAITGTGTGRTSGTATGRAAGRPPLSGRPPAGGP
ncbi:hypothetical protein GCM10017559_48460 [Streptosporangium longisporum]|uniref:Integral membrane protein n=2 Tax=Streptosporangium longisporum TaxID=46187 RepID=A0ABN3Y4V6_9ACTN